MTSANILPLPSRPLVTGCTDQEQPLLFDGCVASERLRRHVQKAVQSLEMRQVSELRRKCEWLARQLVDYKATKAENNALRKRFKRLLQVKLKAEEKAETLDKSLQVAHSIAAQRIRETNTYATCVLNLYESACGIIQQHIIKTHGKERWLTHKCPDCCPQPIHQFSVMPLPSGTLAFSPYCLACEEKRRKQVKAVMKQTIKETAAEMVDRVPKVARQLVERFEEEVESNLHEG